MNFEENFMPAADSNGSPSVTRYALGARGIDFIEKTVGTGNAQKTYPLYDGHGNMVATISTAGTLSNQRTYDVWGGVRAQNGVDGVNPAERHVGNLGHKADDESGLIYMRARYYDPSTGRFVSQDPAMDGANWFVYCTNDPVNRVDVDGRFDAMDAMQLMFVLNGMFRSALFRPVISGILVGGLVSFTCCGFGILLGAAAVALGIIEAGYELAGIIRSQGWLPKGVEFGAKGLKVQSYGALSEILSFFAALYGLLYLGFKYLEPLIVGDGGDGA